VAGGRADQEEGGRREEGERRKEEGGRRRGRGEGGRGSGPSSELVAGERQAGVPAGFAQRKTRA